MRRGKFFEILDEEIALIISKVDARTYKFTGYKEKLISKGPEKPPRQISIPTIRDRLTLRVLCDLITHQFSECKTKPPHKYIQEIKSAVDAVDDGFCFLRIDVKNYYPTIRHDLLLRRVRQRIRKTEIVELILKAVSTPTGKANSSQNQTNMGVPQGLSISNVLSALYLRHLDQKFKKQTLYWRYVDDVLVICRSEDVDGIFNQLNKEISHVGLECHELDSAISGKTRVASLDTGIDYLGYQISRDGLSVRRSSYRRMFVNILNVFTHYKYKKNAEKFLWRLNLKITGCIFESKRKGWVFFFSQTEDLKQLKRLDKFVSDLVKRYNVKVAQNEVKLFVRAYHEIRYNAANTKYVPNFENFDIEEKKKTIALLTGKSFNEIDTWPVELIDEEFKKCAAKETSVLEQDLMDVFS